ncbi:MAG: hypothetical protein ABSF03_23275 [Streptosporangiaceae bacterium]
MTVQVGKLTVRTARPGAGRDAGFRVRSESLLRSLDLHPPGLPERSVLVVRRMELAPVDGTTAQRTRAALADLRRGAARPAAGPVEASAGAVLFDDEVELLTCLTADVVRGTAGRRWYWREIVPVFSAGRGAEAGAAQLATAWVSHVRWLPGSLAGLPEPAARSAVSLLSPAQTSTVLRALLAAFGADERSSARSPADPPTPEPADRRPTEAPWRRWLPATSLDPHAEALLGVALSLHHAPVLVRRPAYAERLRAWRAASGDVSWRRSPPPAAPPPGAPSGKASSQETRPAGAPLRLTPPGGGLLPDAPGKAPPGAAPPAGPSPARADPGPHRPASAPQAGAAATARAPTVAGAGGTPGEEPAATPARAPRAPAAHDAEASGETTLEETPAEPPGDGDTVALATSAWPDEGIATGLASLLYLVNFAVWLDADEDTLVPTGWALVDLLGRHLLGARLGGFADDSLWDVLAELDGRRAGTVPAVELGPADPLRLPQAWLRRWPPPGRTYIACRRGERLVLRHREAGFVVSDVPCPADRLDEVCAAEGALLGDPEIILDAPATSAPATPGERFGDAVGAFVGWLLRSRGISVSSLAAPGRVQVTGTHVDVVLSLQDVDLAVRVAGLDRDPGWVPLLGRIVLFHFLAAPC